MHDFDLERRSPFTNAIALVRRDPASFLVASALLTLIELIANLGYLTLAQGIIEIIILASVACHAHRTYLLGETMPLLTGSATEEGRAVTRLILRMLLIFIAIVAVVLILTFAIIRPADDRMGLGAALLITLCLHGAFLVTLGTMIPDIALGHRGRVRDAWERGRGQRLVVLGRLLLYPVGIGIALQFAVKLLQLTGLPMEMVDDTGRGTALMERPGDEPPLRIKYLGDPGGGIVWTGFPVQLALSASYVFAAYMTASILSRAYLVGGGMGGLRAHRAR